MVVEPVDGEPVSGTDFPVEREFTGKIQKSCLHSYELALILRLNYSELKAISLNSTTGKFSGYQGIFESFSGKAVGAE